MHNRLGSYETIWASTPEEVRCAQALRYEVFAQELNASLVGADRQLDIDPFDEYCEHLLIRHVDTDRVVGTYRILSPESAKRCGRLYSEDEFNLEAFASIRPQLVEVGRSCVHVDFRQGGVILALWKALGAYMHQHQYRWMLGCASVSLEDGGDVAASLYRIFRENAGLDTDFDASPCIPLDMRHLNNQLNVEPPPLLKGYIRLGAKICGEPAYDARFQTADFLTLLDCQAMSSSYAKRFLI